ncbi:antibiotic biosynthesis monooxygenase [Gordonia sp. X0973]|uniref:putative quinol monooxygenase n=1 Tax=Gordonia sp. X0973 TaxID=2742602 RepID=UPI0013EE05B1|nr:antibiotic biosynthesis monooxygenase [Gordonia sp. X0973]QKT07969.1 antibiotic biosynthesis monooxygenase [Gordonia sp. X0973]
MTEIVLSGVRICADDEQVAVVQEQLPRHIELTRAEPGCLEFSVLQTDDPLVWQVDERFADETAFDAHQRRVAESDWGRVTVGIERAYAIRTVG